MQVKKLRLKTQPFDNTGVYENGNSVDPVSEIPSRNFSHMNTPTVTETQLRQLNLVIEPRIHKS